MKPQPGDLVRVDESRKPLGARSHLPWKRYKFLGYGPDGRAELMPLTLPIYADVRDLRRIENEFEI